MRDKRIDIHLARAIIKEEMIKEGVKIGPYTAEEIDKAVKAILEAKDAKRD